MPVASGADGALVLWETCIAIFLIARRAGVGSSADDAGAAVATLASKDLSIVPIVSAYRTWLTEIRRSNVISGQGAYVIEWGCFVILH